MEVLLQAVDMYLHTEDITLTDIQNKLHISYKEIKAELERLGYFITKGCKRKFVIGLKLAIDEYKANSNISLTQLAKKYDIRRGNLSKKLKTLGYVITNNLNAVKFNENIFDCIDTEEKAYWLGFIYADGYIESHTQKKKNYHFELSLKADDYDHLCKFATFIGYLDTVVRVSKTSCNGKICERARISFRNKHLWHALYDKGCLPKKSLILQFPDISVFEDLSLIKHFIRGYIDGDGCLSWADKQHQKPHLQMLGTEDFLNELRKYVPNKGYLYKPKTKNVWSLCFTGKNAFEIADFLYSDENVCLTRKKLRYLEYCRLYLQ